MSGLVHRDTFNSLRLGLVPKSTATVADALSKRKQKIVAAVTVPVRRRNRNFISLHSAVHIVYGSDKTPSTNLDKLSKAFFALYWNAGQL